MKATTVRLIGKRLLLFCAVLVVLPLLMIAKMEAWLSNSEWWFCGIGTLLSIVPGRTGNFLRLAFYRYTLQSCSTDVVIGFGVLIPHRGTEIGRHTAIGPYSIIGTATLGNHVLVGTRVSIMSGLRQHAERAPDTTIPDPTFERMHIGSNTWIGEGAIVGANIGERCVLAAGSVLFRPLADGKTAMGNPARPILSTQIPTPEKVPAT